MKKTAVVLFAVLLFGRMSCRAETAPFLSTDDIPSWEFFLSPPPTPTDASFDHDRQRYQWGKSLRGTDRGRQAAQDAVCNSEYIFKMFSSPFGVTISEENTPELAAFLKRLGATVLLCTRK